MRQKLICLVVACFMISTIPLSVSADKSENIPTNAAGSGVHDTLVAALIQADLVSVLEGNGPFTIFAPTDTAFESFGNLSDINTTMKIDDLAHILLYHVYSGSLTSSDINDGMQVTMANGDDVGFTVSSDGTVYIEDSTVTTADIEASNGIIHFIDSVMSPTSPPANTSDYSISVLAEGTTLSEALTQVNLTSTLQGDGPFTVFAPTDEAFAAAGIDLSTFDTDEENATLVDILKYHVVSGNVLSSDLVDGMETSALNNDKLTFTVNADGVKVNDATVTSADVIASNGVLHFIDKVLMPPADLQDIPTIAQATGVHGALVAALTQANLVSVLQGDGPFTVFAPTDEAFAAAGIDLSTFDTDEENATLVDILKYHVVSGNVLSSDLVDGMETSALNNDKLTFTVNADGVKVNDATVTSADVIASNGVIHVIDKVLMPPVDLPACDYTVGIGLSGMAFNPSVVEVNVGETVCWQWTNATMAHNVKEVIEDKSKIFVDAGVTSGDAQLTTDFRYTFTEDNSTFYYVCEPHILAEMYGKIVVGDGGVISEESKPTTTKDSGESNTPGFISITAIISLLGALVYARNGRN